MTRRSPERRDAPAGAVLAYRDFLHDAPRRALAEAVLAEIPDARIERTDSSPPSVRDRGAADPDAVVLAVDRRRLEDCVGAVGAMRARWPIVPLVVLVEGVEPAGITRLLNAGASDFAELDAAPALAALRIRRAMGTLTSESAASQRRDDRLLQVDPSMRKRLIGTAPEFLALLGRLSLMARTSATVLLLGETGTGKEVCAQAIHYCSPRAHGPWVPINCAAIPADLVEAELFGHTRGAYTDATAARTGLVPEADGGTLFLDEIDSLPLPAQAKLLRFLQDGEYRALGSSTTRHADVRVIAAANCDLALAASRGRFRPDLYYRLNVLNLTMPALRTRRGDIPALAWHFLQRASGEGGRPLIGISPAALRRLVAHDWPGNVRELKHAIERAALFGTGPVLEAADLEIDGGGGGGWEAPLSFRDAKARVVEAFERRFLEELLAEAGGNISQAARAARKNRRALFALVRRHAIDVSRFRTS